MPPFCPLSSRMNQVSPSRCCHFHGIVVWPGSAPMSIKPAEPKRLKRVACPGARRNLSSPRGEILTTLRIRSLGREAAANALISERLNHWKAAMRERGAPGLPLARQS